MASVSVNPPKTPVTQGSKGVAAATLPNVCKMPGPPAPFVPTPLPNVARSEIQPKGYTKSVKIEGHPVAVKGASFGSQGDIASKSTGGGLISSNTHGPAKFVGPGSLTVKAEGKSIHLLGDPMLNNCAPSGSPANSATVAGEVQPAVWAAIQKNPGNADECGPGNHVEKVYFPDVPREEMSVKRRIAKLRELADGDRQALYEAVAAMHNYQAGTLDHGKQISRELSEEEREADWHPDSQKVMAVCQVCGYRREIDHASDPKNVVEAKYDPGAITSGSQQKNNVAFAAKPGHSSTYKAPSASAKTVDALKAKNLRFIPTGR